MRFPRLWRRALAIVFFSAGACGGRVVDVGPGDSGATVEAGASPPGCSTTVQVTRDGPCAAAKHECGDDGSTHCGACLSGESCAAARCYDAVGPLLPRADLFRGVYASGEGFECAVEVGGELERVETPLWQDGITAIVMEVYTSCDGPLTKVAEVRRPASEFPGKEPMNDASKVWRVDPPIALQPGAKVRVLFHAEGSHEGVPGTGAGARALTESVTMRDIDPRCRFVSLAWAGLPDGPSLDWDFDGLLFVHPR